LPPEAVDIFLTRNRTLVVQPAAIHIIYVCFPFHVSVNITNEAMLIYACASSFVITSNFIFRINLLHKECIKTDNEVLENIYP